MYAQDRLRYLTGTHAIAGCRVHYLLDFCMRMGYRRMSFTRYMGQQRAMASMVKDITGGHGAATLVGFGNWGAQTHAGFIKACPRGPVLKLRRALASVCTVVGIDEHRTSKLCSACHNVNKHMTTRQVVREGGGEGAGDVESRTKLIPVYSVLFCSNKTCNARVDRDANAARNILFLTQKLVEGEERPWQFCRNRNNTPGLLSDGALVSSMRARFREREALRVRGAVGQAAHATQA